MFIMKSSVSLVIFALVLLIEWCPVSVGMPGAPQDIDIKEHESGQNALKYAVDQHNNRTNDMFLRDVSEVLRAQSQVVEGHLYTFKVNMARTNCTKDTIDEVCVIQQEPKDALAYECTFSVWSRPWLDSTIVTEKCNYENSTVLQSLQN